MNDDAFEWDDAPLWRGMIDDGLLRKAVLLRRAPAGGTAPPTTPKAHAGGQFIPASDWLREKQIAKDALPGIIDTFGTQMQYLRMVWQATAELGDNVPKSMPTAGQTRWMMKTVIRDTYENAFTQGKRAAGNLFAVTEADRKAIKKTRRDEFTYLEKFMRDMETGGGKMDYAQRMDYYAKAARELYWLGFVCGNTDKSRTIRWNLGPTEHCFPAGTLVTTSDGQQPIESVRIGDLVKTASGNKRVTKVYASTFRGALISVECSGATVKCTPSHPFLTGRGWVNAVDLRHDDVLVIEKHLADKVRSDVTIPNTNDRISARAKIGITGGIPALLANLPFSKRIKPWMPVPIFSVRLDNEPCAYHNIDDKLRLDKDVALVRHAHGVEYGAESPLQAARLVLLESRLGFIELAHYVGNHVRVLASPFRNLGPDFGPLHRICRRHIFPSAGMNDAARGVLVDTKPHDIGLITNLYERESELRCYITGTHSGIVISNKLGVLRGEYGASRTSHTVNRIIVDEFAAFGAVWLIRLAALFRGYMSITARRATESRQFRGGPNTSFKGDSAALAYELSHNSVPLQSVYQNSRETVTVYNLEVADEHHYYANGILVHNCDTCLGAASQGPIRADAFFKEYASKGILPQSGALDCLGYRCMCSLTDSTPEVEALERGRLRRRSA